MDKVAGRARCARQESNENENEKEDWLTGDEKMALAKKKAPLSRLSLLRECCMRMCLR